MIPLPPGGRVEGRRPPRGVGDALRLLFVGTAAPPISDLTPLIEAVRSRSGIELTVVCPPADREFVATVADGCERVTIVHAHGAALDEHYEHSDIACLVFAADAYRDLAMPIKLFEAIGRGVPVLANGPNAVTDFVEETGVGWTVSTPDELEVLLAALSQDRDLVTARTAAVEELRSAHTWLERAREAAAALSGPADRPPPTPAREPAPRSAGRRRWRGREAGRRWLRR